MRAGCLHESAALLHMFCKEHEQEKNEWKDKELQGCRQRKSKGGISGGVDTCRCHPCKKTKRKGRERLLRSKLLEHKEEEGNRHGIPCGVGHLQVPFMHKEEQ